MKKLTRNDCIEIYCALCSLDEEPPLIDKIGPDGDDLAAGLVVLTTDEIKTASLAVSEKLDRLRGGFYDDYPGECDKPGSTCGKWIRHMETIGRKLAAMTAAF